MIRYLGKRYNVLMTCISFDGSFTCTDIGVHPNVVKGLANDGYLDIVGGKSRKSPYRYLVSDRVRRHYNRKGF